MRKPYRAVIIIISLVGVLLIGLVAYFYQQATDEEVSSPSGSQQDAVPAEPSDLPPLDDDTEPTEDAEAAGDEYLQSFVGLSEEAAAEKAEEDDTPHRVVARDGEQLPVTMDYNPERVNFIVEDGVVTDARYD